MVYPTFRPNAVTYLGPFNSYIALFIFGIMYGFLTKLAFSLRKFDTICTLPFHLDIMNIGLAQWEYASFFSISCTSMRYIFYTGYPYICGILETTYYVPALLLLFSK